MTFNRAELSDLLKSLKPAVSKQDMVPILQHILWQTGEVRAYNRQVGAIVKFDTQGIEGMIPFQRFASLINSFSADEVEITQTEMELKVVCGRSHSKIGMMPADDFPSFDSFLGKIDSEGIEVHPELLTGLVKCIPFATKDGPRVELSGVYVKEDLVVATDGRRISCYRCTEPVISGSLIFSGDFVQILTGFDQIDRLFTDATHVVARDGDVTVFGSIVQGTYPNVEQYLPEVPEVVELPKEELIAALTRVGNFSEEPAGGAMCTITFGKKLKVSYSGRVSEIKEFFNFGEILASTSFKTNPFHLVTLLRLCDKFAFVEGQIKVLYGESEDKKFRSVMAIIKAEKV